MWNVGSEGGFSHEGHALHLLQEYRHESLAILVDRSIGAERVRETLAWLLLTRGVLVFMGATYPTVTGM